MTNSFRTNIFRFALPLTFVVMTIFAQELYLPPFDYAKLLVLLRSIFFIVLTFELGSLVVKKVQERYPALSQTRARLFYSYLSGVLVAFTIITISTLISRWISPKFFSFGYESLLNFVQSLWFGFLIASSCEMLYAYELSFQNEKQSNELEKGALEARFEALQAKMNPHFLFNTLNTLSSLIIKDPVKAENFSVEMAYVYRYMLQNIDAPLVTLQKELDFTRSYIHLMKVRFEDEIVVDLDINSDLLSMKLPPLSLQLLVENAIKHNMVSREDPLYINIQTIDQEHIQVTNSVNLKQKASDESGTGLSSLQMRYELLRQEPITVKNDDDKFVVTLKLI